MPPAFSQGLAVLNPLLPPPGATHAIHHGNFLRLKSGGLLLVQGGKYEVRGSGGTRLALGSWFKRSIPERAGRGTLYKVEWEKDGARGGRREENRAQDQLPVTWHHRQHCPHHLSCPPPLSSGHPCSVSALFSSSRTSLSSAPR